MHVLTPLALISAATVGAATVSQPRAQQKEPQQKQAQQSQSQTSQSQSQSGRAQAARQDQAGQQQGQKPAQQPAQKQGQGVVRVNAQDPGNIQPSGEKPEWAPNIDPQMLAVIEQLGAFDAPPITRLSPRLAREVPLPADAVAALLKKTGIEPVEPKVKVGHRVIPGPTPEGILIRTYTPIDAQSKQQAGQPSGQQQQARQQVQAGGQANQQQAGQQASEQNAQQGLPVIVYYHGGGWVLAGLDTYEASAQALAEKTGAIVASVAYRQAPEHPFPASHMDAFEAYRWISQNAGQLGGDPDRVAVAGESAGGNLAAAVSVLARDRGIKQPVHQVLVYPVVAHDFNLPSYQEYQNAKPLNPEMMRWFFANLFHGDVSGPVNRLIALIEMEDLSNLPPATIINAQIDPLRSEGEIFARLLEQAGNDVEQQTFEGVTHEFFGMDAVLEQAGEAQDLAAERLKSAFEAEQLSAVGE